MKKWYASKLIWLGIVEIAMATILETTDSASTWQSISLAGLGALTVLIRGITSQRIGS